jgi:hypothetical protein
MPGPAQSSLLNLFFFYQFSYINLGIWN